MFKISKIGRGAALLLEWVINLPLTIWRHRLEFALGVGGLLLLNSLFIAEFLRGKQFNRSSAGLLGDFTGGYVGTLFALISVYLLYLTLKRQQASGAIASFEVKFFELINLHRANVAEMKLQNVQGRRIFVLLIVELRAIRETVIEAMTQLQMVDESPLHEEKIWHISYYFLYFGIGHHSSPMVRTALEQYDAQLIQRIDDLLSAQYFRQQVKKRLKDVYLPFEGHQSRLGHYYRHLYQSVVYVHKQPMELKEKIKYVKMLRAQLSTHEQALLFINSLTPVGSAWWDSNLILDYKLIKNVPQKFFDPETEIDITSYFSSDYFEWRSTKLVSRKRLTI